MNITINTASRGAQTKDLFGIFFEDLNHAADGGLYAELVQNRSFEFAPIDRHDYHNLTAWEILGEATVVIENSEPLNTNNPHYAAITLYGVGGLCNLGFNSGIPIRSGAAYNFFCYARSAVEKQELRISLESKEGKCYAEVTVIIDSNNWKKYELSFTAGEFQTLTASAVIPGRLALRSKGKGTFYLDMVSLFPADTFKGRKNGMRKDIAEMLEIMQPKFMRFPGGCLVHDGSLDPNARNSMYRWKNTIGPVESRPARRSNWGYNQTLGLGYYEYFLFCEDIGTKPLPVLPAGWNPHNKDAAPLDQMQPWINDALDLIEFANGGIDTPWGAKRAELGHSAPFNLEYIAIGNEEVGDEFFERYSLFHHAIREKYPQIKIINSAAAWAAGSEFEKGWASARAHGSDLVDEHYYNSPEWFIANMRRYDSYKAEDPKVFLGEYASWGNTWYNALVEAAFMIGLERNAHIVGLACYAPMLCNAGYVNWQPDLIWFDNFRVYGSANYYVQKLFMQNQSTHLLDVQVKNAPPPQLPKDQNITGEIGIENARFPVSLYDIKLVFDGEEKCINNVVLNAEREKVIFANIDAHSFSLHCKAWEMGDEQIIRDRGFRIFFGRKDDNNTLLWEIGGWQNQDVIILSRVNGKSSALTQYLFTLESNKEYDLRLEVQGRQIRTFINGIPVNDTIDVIPAAESLYYNAGIDERNGDIIVKCANIKEEDITVEFNIENVNREIKEARVFQLSGYAKADENSFDNPEKVKPKEFLIPAQKSFVYTFPKESVTVLRL